MKQAVRLAVPVCYDVQCHSATVTILGHEGVPVHVDGEAWIQPPSVIRIHHKNRAQVLIRDKVLVYALLLGYVD